MTEIRRETNEKEKMGDGKEKTYSFQKFGA